MSRKKNVSTREAPRVGALLRRCWQHVRARIYAGIKAAGYADLNPAHVGMFRFEGLDGRRPSQLAEEMQITKQSVNDLLRHLELNGYLKLETDAGDRRARVIRLTPRGSRLEDTAWEYATRAEQELAAVLGKRNFQRFRDTLVQIASFSGDFPPEWHDAAFGRTRKGR